MLEFGSVTASMQRPPLGDKVSQSVQISDRVAPIRSFLVGRLDPARQSWGLLYLLDPSTRTVPIIRSSRIGRLPFLVHMLKLRM